jgi:hypothetical protein
VVYLLCFQSFRGTLQNIPEPDVKLVFNTFGIFLIVGRVVTEGVFLFLRICGDMVSTKLEIFGPGVLQSKFVPPGPEYFCANPGVIHVGDRTKVYKCETFGAIEGTSCNAVLPMPMTATRLPLRSVDLSYTAVWIRMPLKL